jgi:hypothetical protein
LHLTLTTEYLVEDFSAELTGLVFFDMKRQMLFEDASLRKRLSAELTQKRFGVDFLFFQLFPIFLCQATNVAIRGRARHGVTL